MSPIRVLAVLALAACQTTPEPTDELPAEIASTCDPLDPSVCALPFPSSHYLVKADTVTGRRVAFGEETLPVNRDDIRTVPTFWNERDGYSINSAMLFYMDDVDLTGPGLPTHADIGSYADADARVVVVDATTGERHPIWIELDATAPSDDQRLVTIRPAKPFEWNRTYVVGLRGLKDATGAEIAPSSAFAALRDGAEHEAPAVAAREVHFDAVVFPTLEAAGFARADLQLAWDFHTASRENTLGKQEFIRDDAFAWIEEQGGFDLTIDSVEDRDCGVEGEHIARDLRGHFSLPLYLEADGPEDYQDTELQAVFTRGADGMPYRNGTSVADFLMRIPCSVAEGPEGEGPVAAPVIQYGHGLLGDKDEARTGWLAKFLDEKGFVVFAMDWTGFMEDDTMPITFMLASISQETLNPSHFAITSERSQQGMVEQMLGTRLVKTVLADREELQIDGQPLIDPTQVTYYGISQGAIMGSALVAMSPDLPRGVLSVGGGPYSLLLPRSHDFDEFFLLLKQKYYDHREIMLFVVGLTQQLWDATEPGGWVWDMTRDAETPKQILQQVAIYDNQVTTLGAAYQARAYGAALLDEPVRPVWGLEAVDASGAGVDGSALVEWKYTDVPEEPFEAIPPATEEFTPAEYLDGRELDPHECPRREPEGQAQVDIFLKTGKIVQTCPPGGCVGTVAGTCD